MKYYIAVNNERKGPFEEYELLNNGLTPDTLVWCKGMDDWKLAREVSELNYLLGGAPQPTPNPQPQPHGGWQQQPYGPMLPPYNWLGPAILVTILCCSPLGVIAIIKAVSVGYLFREGQYEAAQNASTQARNWVIGAALAGVAYIMLQYTYLQQMMPNLLQGLH